MEGMSVLMWELTIWSGKENKMDKSVQIIIFVFM